MNFKKVVTQQGVPLYCMEMPWAKSVATGVLVKAGTRDEIWPKEAGIAHALEHMVFQGTEEFLDSKILSAYLEDVGGHLNAWTWKEMTFYHNLLPAGKLERGIKVLSQMIRKPLLRGENIKVEMLNVIQEIKRANDDHASYLGRKAEKIIYNSHPLGRDTLGTKEAVSRFTPDDFADFMKRLYLPENFIFLSIGNVTAEKAKELFEKYFPEKAGSFINRRGVIAENGPQEKLFVIPRQVEQCHLVIGSLICNFASPDSYPISLFQTMIDGGMSFPLFQEVRDKKGLAYAVSADCSFWSDRGDFGIYIGTDPARKDEAIKTALDVLRQSKCSEDLLERAKEVQIGQMALRYESSASVLAIAARQLGMLGKVISYKEKIRKIRSVTIKQVEDAVDKYLSEDKLVTVMLVPKKK